MTDQKEIPVVSMNNTKKEMIDAYNAAKQRLEATEKRLLDAEKVRRKMEEKAADVVAESQASQDPLQRLHDLRGAFSRELTGLAERFEAEIETYKKIQTAVKTKQEELQNIYEVETAASDLAALIASQHVRKEEFKTEMEKTGTEFEEEIREARANWDREKAEQDQEIEEQASFLKKQRQREKEDYEYTFAREKDQRKNELEDQLKALEKELITKREAFEQELQQRRDDLDNREKIISEREQVFSQLQNQVETFPKTLEKQVQAAKEKTAERLVSDFEKNRELMESKFEGEKNVLKGKVESLEAMVKVQTTQIEELSRKHEQAYEKVQDIANRAVAAAKREIISVPYRPGFTGNDEKQVG
jgi:chromosome segregation ATPase